MKINSNLVKTTPKGMPFNFCVFGDPTQEIKDWISFHNLKTETSGKFTNILIGDSDVNDMFIQPDKFKYVDGFSPNLNKHLHLGHFSNLILGKAFQSLGIGEKFIAILGDTLDGSVDQKDAYEKYINLCKEFNYNIDNIVFASEQKLDDESLLKDGDGAYDGTKIFEVGDEKIVGIKSTGKTTYFYQDVALAQKLNDSTLYLTGFEQDGHFKNLNNLFPNTKHIGLGLVSIDGKKMSSSEGNVLLLQDVLDAVAEKFNGDKELAWNVISGHILKYDPTSLKNINMKQIDDVKASAGLYFSYTLAKLKSAGMIPVEIETFNSNALKFKYIKAKSNLAPNILFEELFELTKHISGLYVKLHIKDNLENQKIYQPLLDDLLLGMKKLGMFNIDKV